MIDVALLCCTKDSLKQNASTCLGPLWVLVGDHYNHSLSDASVTEVQQLDQPWPFLSKTRGVI